MKNNKGITLTSLTIYVIVAGTVIASLAFININFVSQIGALSKKADIINEYSKFYSSFLTDVKNSSDVTTYTKNEVVLSNGVKYSIKKVPNRNEYAVYKNSIVICEGIVLDDSGSAPYFDYDYMNNNLIVSLRFKNDGYEIFLNNGFEVGKGF